MVKKFSILPIIGILNMDKFYVYFIFYHFFNKNLVHFKKKKQKGKLMAEEGEVEVQKKSGGKMMLVIIIVLILLILIGGGLAAFLLLSGDNEEVSSAPQQTQQTQMQRKKGISGRSTNLLTIGPMYPMDQFVVNLLSESGGRFLKTSLDIELENQEMSPEMDMKKPAIRDIIIRTLSSKTFEEIGTEKGKERLKDEIVEKINEILADGQVKNIFFTDFVVQ